MPIAASTAYTTPYASLCPARRLPVGNIARRQFFELADIAKNARRGRSPTAISPIALAAVQRIDAARLGLRGTEIQADVNAMTKR